MLSNHADWTIGRLLCSSLFLPHSRYISWYHLTAQFFVNLADSDEKKLKNVEIALELIGEAGCKLPAKVRAHDIVHHDVKSTLRVIYCMYEKFIKA